MPDRPRYGASYRRPSALSAKPKETPFQVLATSVINQQLSQKAADAIEARVVALTAQFEPEALLRIKQEKLRLAGLSRNKAEFLHTLAKKRWPAIGRKRIA